MQHRAWYVQAVAGLVAWTIAGCRPPPMSDVTAARLGALEAEVAAIEEDEARASRAAEEAHDRAVAAEAAVWDEAEASGVERYAALLVTAKYAALCNLEYDRLVEVRRGLAAFAAEPERDAALAGLEPCRVQAAAERTKFHTEARDEMRHDFARELELGFDVNHAAERGGMVATVRGDVLHVDLAGHRGWKSYASERIVEQWCADSTVFREIVLRNAHGTFRCRPDFTGARHVEDRLREEGLAEPWIPVVAGPTPTPTPTSAAELARLVAAADQAAVGSTAAAANLAHVREYRDARKLRLTTLRADHENRVTEWRLKRAAHADRGAVAMIVVGTIALVASAVLIPVGSYYADRFKAIRKGTVEFASSAEYAAAEKQARSVGLGASLAGLVGLSAGPRLLLGGLRMRSCQLSLAPGGLRLKF